MFCLNISVHINEIWACPDDSLCIRTVNGGELRRTFSSYSASFFNIFFFSSFGFDVGTWYFVRLLTVIQYSILFWTFTEVIHCDRLLIFNFFFFLFWCLYVTVYSCCPSKKSFCWNIYESNHTVLFTFCLVQYVWTFKMALIFCISLFLKHSSNLRQRS